MLSICRVGLGREEYYLATAASGRDHREGLIEPSAVWMGHGAEHLGLSGPAGARAIRLVLRGVHPATGDLLLEEPGRRRNAAYDCTFSVPKSVSLLHAFSPEVEVREQVRLGHEAAVRASLGYLEQEAVGVRLQGVDGPRLSREPDLVGVGFLHRLSRSGDPHLHTHVIVANLVPDRLAPGGHPLDATGLFMQCRTAGALYETHLRYELTRRLGVEWQPLEGRCWTDLKGLDSAVVRAFSQRAAQIEAGLAAEGWQGAAARRTMAEITRPPKDVTRSYEDAVEAARARLWRAGVTDTRLRDVCYRVPPGARDALTTPSPEDGWRIDALRQLPLRSIDGTFTERDAIRARCATARHGLPVAGVLRDASALLSDASVLERGEHRIHLRGGTTGSIPVGRSEQLFTTREMEAIEERVRVLVGSMMAARPGSVRALAYEPGGRFDALDSLSRVVAAWRAEGRAVLGIAPGRWAAAGIESCAGIDAVVVPGVSRGVFGVSGVSGVSGGVSLGASGLPGGVSLGAPAASGGVREGRGRLDWGEPTVAGSVVVPGSVVVVAEAQCFGHEALRGILQACSQAGADVVLVAPSRVIAQRRALGEVTALEKSSIDASGRIGTGAGAGAGAGAGSSGHHRAVESALEEPAPFAQLRFASVDVTLVASLGDGAAEAARRVTGGRSGVPGNPRSDGKRTLVVAGDEAVVAAIRAVPGVRPDDVTHARDLKAVLGGHDDGAVHLVVIGGGSVLRQGMTAPPDLERSHVIVAPGIDRWSADGLGRAAEAARPSYLVRTLGGPASTVEGREAWRAAAGAVETFRARWQITSARSAFGEGELSRSGGTAGVDRTTGADRTTGVDRTTELLSVEKLVSRTRSLGRERGGRRPERERESGPGLGIGR